MIKSNKAILFFIFLLISASACAEQRWRTKTQNGQFLVTISPQSGFYQIGDYHDWIIEVKDGNGKLVSNANVSISGGMLGHGHGLPSQPVINPIDGDGKYLLEGMLFSMAGEWTLLFLVQTSKVQDRARFDINLTF